MVARSELSGTLGEHVLSKGAMNVIQKAEELGINTSAQIIAATIYADANGKRKITVIPGGPIDYLKGVVVRKQRQGEIFSGFMPR